MASTSEFKLVVDTNVLVRGLANRSSASGRLLKLCEERSMRVLLSRPIIREYREVLLRRELTLQHPAITPQAVGLVIERLRYFSDMIDPVRARFRYDRDPDDEAFIELAVSGSATHIMTHDKDLLSLPSSRTDAGKRFRQRLPIVQVCDALSLIRAIEEI